jgi:DtxR family Mn-dependent transcriptional regulator
VNDLIDTTEMYLRTIFELEEEGVVPLRARIAERLGQSGPTVSQTVARMERDGLLTVADDRHLELTAEGRSRATSVMRKHRLAELLLVDVIGLEWEQLVALLGNPTMSPYGNPIPGLDELGVGEAAGPIEPNLVRLDEVARRGGGTVEVRRIAEHVQLDPTLMADLHKVDAVPGNVVEVAAQARASQPIVLSGRGTTVEVGGALAHAVMGRRR